ncbi:hypothetical protein CROQUDRAFT_38636 [Cronartium quercuum f. sp. fusiforme G11]|uniref:Uncharacterized protein n=1 Tax=Cronartium quercuum f. sp. fusiforme G11 TaxID=708437 RepID=A0A9P6TG05_9BASI|nr:hypothetical protein CROQUDRAFT_38636 [Cronartium quercuum f. sp. fusiforme G11]
MSVQQEVEKHQNPTIKIISDNRFDEGINETSFGKSLLPKQKTTIEHIIRTYYNEFGLGKYQLGKIEKHQVNITLNTNKPYPPILKKNPYPASPHNRVEIEKGIDESLKVRIIMLSW